MLRTHANTPTPASAADAAAWRLVRLMPAGFRRTAGLDTALVELQMR
jgi:hypothetical protein